ncbi:hypothetical protein SASPL_127445 [Salvia splendens]|uniref:Disease resistance protein RPM1 n=1 Tax=Salvia splendens TaxID=180675 RepID=A0A8X8ZLU2_SALSN|nr:probable disease resistance protein RF45 [Salvia splendens]KAG6409406.1 hypothetical protein SASPL_127445 [Salvia splendens]
MEVVASTVRLLADLLLYKINFLRAVEGRVELLKDELKRIQCFLKDANQKQADNEGVRNWISEIREVALDSRDVIEMFILKVESKSRLGKFSTFPKHMHYVNKAGKEIDAIQERLQAIHRSRLSYGIRDLGEEAEPVSGSGSRVESWRRMPIWQKDQDFVGVRDDDMRKLLQESILDEGKREGLSIAVVEGMAGIGKSTLARKIYNVVSGRFDCRCWVVVSSGFDPRETIKQLIMQLPKSARLRDEIGKIEKSTKDERYLLEKLQEMLHEQLKGKTYFIVLDDVWEIEHWESLRYAFPDKQDKPSRLLITTRNKTITNYSNYALEVKVLNLKQSWELFLNKAFIHTKNPQCPKELEPIGREIVEKCNGLPLAITVVGGLLVEPHTKRRWEEVLEQVNSHHRRAESRISTILELSYQNLSLELKSCFLCLACFKEDANIPAKRLIHIWVGHGLIRPEGRRTVDDIARGYLDELINRNMVQIKDLTLDDRVKNCHLHDLFREVCLVKAKEEVGFHIIEKGKEKEAMMRTTKPRHHIVYGQNLDTLSRVQSHHLRSLFVINSHSDGLNNVFVNTPFRFWKSFQLLEILYLEGVGWRNFPHSFRSLIGLRYLRIRSGSFERIQIPKWFGHLDKLEVIDAMSENLELPDANPEMEGLRYFSAARIHGLTTMQSLKHVETLKYIGVDDLLRCTSLSTCSVRELGLFLNHEIESDVLKRARASLENMKNLMKLQLMWDLSLSIEPSMIPLLAGLTKLKLRGGMRRCPDPCVFPPNLTHLTLVETFLEEDPMTELGNLPKLEYLKLTGYACLGERLRVLQGGFPNLKGLSIKDMYFLKGIDVEEGGMPQLKLLRIRHCPALKTTNLPLRIITLL